MRFLSFAVFLLLPAIAFADPAGIQVQNAWSRAMPAGSAGVVYLTITDNGPADTLTGVSSPVANQAELHESIDDHGVMKMRAVSSLHVVRGKPMTLAPDGYHIMLMGLKHPLVAGTTFPVTLHFVHAGSITTMATVEKLGATMQGTNQGGMGNMSGMNMK